MTNGSDEILNEDLETIKSDGKVKVDPRDEVSKSTEFPISDKNELLNNVYKMQNEPLN